MRHQSSVTSISWIPSQAIEGTQRLAFEAGLAHYDPPPPDEITSESLEELRVGDRFRFANVLKAWIEVDDDGRIAGHGSDGGRLMGATTLKIGRLARTFEALGLPDICKQPELGDGWVRFVQTAGGRTGVPAPRRVRRAPFIQWQAPLVWTTLSLTLHADGRTDAEMIGASRFPRHWVYDDAGKLFLKSGLANFREWWRVSFGPHTPWGERDSEALVTVVETALERQLSAQLMSGKPEFRRLKAGATLVREGDAGAEVFLVLDGVLRVEKDGQRLAEYGPGAMLGERAHLESGGRTSSLIAVTPCRVAAVHASQLERGALEQLATGHRREEAVEPV